MDAQENETMTRVGPGTPAGETLRRYWLPVLFSDEINSEQPKIVRRLAEDLLLFRDEFGRVGLTEPACPHCSVETPAKNFFTRLPRLWPLCLRRISRFTQHNHARIGNRSGKRLNEQRRKRAG